MTSAKKFMYETADEAADSIPYQNTLGLAGTC